MVKIEAETSGIDWISALPDALIIEILSKIPIRDACKTTILSKPWQNMWTCIHHLHLWYYNESMYLCSNRDFYSLPQHLCSSSSLVKLKYKYCRIPKDCILNWKSLKSLTLTFMLLSEEHMKQIISNCHHLESLKLSNFCGFHRLHLTSPKCKRLELIDHIHPPDYTGDGDCYFEIVAPYVQHLKISGDFDGVGIRLGDLSSLIHAHLTFSWYDFRVIDKSIVKDHLTSVASANDLIISSLYIKMISMLILQKEDVPLPLLECKRLTINSWARKCTFFGIDRLLRSTPCLENLTIHLEKELSFLNYWREDNYENIFEGSLQNLKILKVILQSDIFINDMTRGQTEVMKYLLESAKNLEKLVIVPTNSHCSKMINSLLAIPVDSNNDVAVSLESVAGVE